MYARDKRVSTEVFEVLREELRLASKNLDDAVASVAYSRNDGSVGPANTGMAETIRQEAIAFSAHAKLVVRMKSVVVVESCTDYDRVLIGAYVTIMDDGHEAKYHIAGDYVPSKRDTANGFRMLSVDSPLGKAIRGGKVGDKVLVSLAEGKSREVTILKIEARPASADN